MAYMIHITRNPAMDEDGPAISLAEWVEAVNQIEHTRLAEGDYSVTLAETGQVFTLRNNGGDTEVHFPGEGWRRVFRHDDNRVMFRAPEDFTDAACHLRAIARQLAEALEAVVSGDEGELYP